MHSHLFAPIAFTLLFTATAAHAQQTWYVDATGSAPGTGTAQDPYTRVDYAVAQPSTVSGDTVSVAQGTYPNEVIDFAGKDITLFSTGALLTSVWDYATPSLVTFQSGESSLAVLDGFTLRGGGGFTNSNFRVGGGVKILGASPTIRNCVFQRPPGNSNFVIEQGGGIYADNSAYHQSFRIENCTFSGLKTRRGAGAYLLNVRAQIVDCIFTNNAAYWEGAGISAQLSSLSIESTEFNSHLSWSEGASGVSANFQQCNVVVRNSTVMRPSHSPDNHGGMSFFRGTAILEDSTFQGLTGEGSGIALRFSQLDPVVTRCDFIDNRYTGDFDCRGAAIYHRTGLLSVRDCLFEDNVAEFGGAIYAWGESDIRNSTFLGNRSERFSGSRGGALILQGTFEVSDCTFESNLCDRRGYVNNHLRGGAIFSDYAGVVRRCTFTNNSAEFSHSGSGPPVSQGGAIYAEAPIDVEYCLFQGNRVGGSTNDDDGGALFGPITASHCTFRDNFGGAGGASAISGGTLLNSIVWPSAAPALSPTVSPSYSIVQGGANGPGILDADPMFWSATDSHLKPGSPAIDAGDPLSPLDPDGTQADMGAYPFDPLQCGPLCSGPVGTTTCLGQANSTGSPAALVAIGSQHVIVDLLILHASQLPVGQFGFFLGSKTPGFVPGFGGSQGDLCLGGSLLRFNSSILIVNAAGQVTQRERLGLFPGGNTVIAGDSWYFQFWHRDQVAGQPTSNTSAGVRVDFL